LTLTLTQSFSTTAPWPATASRSASLSANVGAFDPRAGGRIDHGHDAERVAVAGRAHDHVNADDSVDVNVDANDSVDVNNVDVNVLG
jgi:hypothetical protein